MPCEGGLQCGCCPPAENPFSDSFFEGLDNGVRGLGLILRPQKSPPDVDAIRRELASALDKPTCGKFVKALLKELGRQTGIQPFSSKALDIFDEIKGEGQKGFGNQQGAFVARAGGTIGQGNAHIDFNFSPDPLTTIHELVHAAPNSGTRQYTHEEMALAAYDVSKAQGYSLGRRPEPNLKGDAADYNYSLRFSDRLFAACRTN